MKHLKRLVICCLTALLFLGLTTTPAQAAGYYGYFGEWVNAAGGTPAFCKPAEAFKCFALGSNNWTIHVRLPW